MDPFGLIRMGTFLGIGLLVAPFALLGLAIPYAVLRIRETRSDDPDPQIGLKSALHFILSLSILLVVSGITTLVVDALIDIDKPRQQEFRPQGRPGFPQPVQQVKKDKEFNERQRMGCAFIVSGLVLGLLHLVLLLGFTNDRRRPDVRRVFVGWRFAIHAIVVLITFTTLVILMFQKDIKWDDLKPVVGTLVVWGVSWVIHLVLLYAYLPHSARDRVPRFTPPTLETD